MDFKALCRLPIPKRGTLTKSASGGFDDTNERHYVVVKTLRIVKLTALIVFIACMQVSSATNPQTITLSAKNESLVRIFEVIRQQARYEYLSNSFASHKTSPVTTHSKHRST